MKKDRKQHNINNKFDIPVQEWINGNYSATVLDKIESQIGSITSLSKAQIRKIYEVVIKAESKLKLNAKKDKEKAYKEAYKQLLKLKILLAYSVGKDGKNKREWKNLKELINSALEVLPAPKSGISPQELDKRIEKILAFRDLMEAVVAYHRQEATK